MLFNYVDDIRKTDERIEEVKKSLAKRFRVKSFCYFWGELPVAQDQTSGRVWIGQASYTENVAWKLQGPSQLQLTLATNYYGNGIVRSGETTNLQS